MLDRLISIRDGLVCGCSTSELIADVEAAIAEAEMIKQLEQFPARYIHGVELYPAQGIEH